MTPPIQSLHARYCEITGLDIPWTMQRLYQWEVWEAAGYGEKDLELVVGYIRRRIREKRREKESLLFRNLIGRPENFAEDLAMAKAEARIPRKTERQRVSVAAGIKEPDASASKSAAEIINENVKMATMLKQWKEQNL